MSENSQVTRLLARRFSQPGERGRIVFWRDDKKQYADVVATLVGEHATDEVLREAELIEAGQDRMDFITDLTAFRCWIETTDDRDAIDGNWQTLVRQPIYQNLSPEQSRR